MCELFGKRLHVLKNFHPALMGIEPARGVESWNPLQISTIEREVGERGNWYAEEITSFQTSRKDSLAAPLENIERGKIVCQDESWLPWRTRVLIQE